MVPRLLRCLAAALGALLAAAGVRVAGAQTLDHLKCFRVKDERASSNVRYEFDLTPLPTSPFAVERRCTAKAKARSICIPVAKTSVSPAPFPAPVGAPASVTVCYTARCPRETDLTFDVVDQIGGSGPLLVKSRTQRRDVCVPAVSGTGSTTTTTVASTCGNGVVDPGELCEMGDPCPAAVGYECFQCHGCCAPHSATCAFDVGGPEIPCCDGSPCIILGPHVGVCGIPPPHMCTQPSDCNAVVPTDCVDGVCCSAGGGNPCNAELPCCPPLTCSGGIDPGLCCLPHGQACTSGGECCSHSCSTTTMTCD